MVDAGQGRGRPVGQPGGIAVRGQGQEFAVMGIVAAEGQAGHLQPPAVASTPSSSPGGAAATSERGHPGAARPQPRQKQGGMQVADRGVAAEARRDWRAPRRGRPRRGGRPRRAGEAGRASASTARVSARGPSARGRAPRPGPARCPSCPHAGRGRRPAPAADNGSGPRPWHSRRAAPRSRRGGRRRPGPGEGEEAARKGAACGDALRKKKRGSRT